MIAAAHFDPDAVFIEKGKKVIYGREDLKKEHESFKEKIGRGTAKISDDRYLMAGDYIIVNANYEITPEKEGPVVKGKFTQIWRKTDDKYLVLHEEFTAEEA
ncbi:unnamed protein product [Cylicostephanus goldi]|uniref:DUF4440 domain-containing protein n=1 Tax=Cylicostephanus goldi TaxID=71465 RepID=A0A3P6RDJ3_CYLGO|nr:unnamed protein product [Cylicostephanus goldi]